jgi:hypothetical protein
VTDNTAIQIIKKAVLALPGGLDGVQTVPDKLCNDQGSADKSSDLFESPSYMSMFRSRNSVLVGALAF